ncbi:MAG TPA: hypothetical protein VFU07_07260 [Candidatus Lumbricidophila sp.]|nr:hypothetical protein [Candidatus Lumbricidophila sp.]
MSVKSDRFYWVECDWPTCHERTCDDDGEYLSLSASAAWGDAEEADWAKRGRKHYCPRHHYCRDGIALVANEAKQDVTRRINWELNRAIDRLNNASAKRRYAPELPRITEAIGAATAAFKQLAESLGAVAA